MRHEIINNVERRSRTGICLFKYMELCFEFMKVERYKRRRCVEAIFGDRVTCTFEDNGLTVMFLNSVAETAVKKTEDPRKALEGKMV